MHKADDAPFPVDLLQATEMELPEAPAFLDLPEHRLHALFSFAVARGPFLPLELALHSLRQRRVFRNPSPRRRPAPDPVRHLL